MKLLRVIVLGARGQLGTEIVRRAVSHHHEVTEFIHHPPSSDWNTSTAFRVGDAAKAEDLKAALPGHDVVVNAIGSGTLRASTVESCTTGVAVAATEEAGISRYIAMSAGIVAFKAPLFNHFLRPLIFRNLYAEHLRVEALVTASPLDWTVVRPPRLTNGPSKGYKATPTLPPRSRSIARADVATFILDEIEKNEYVRKVVFLSSNHSTGKSFAKEAGANCRES